MDLTIAELARAVGKSEPYVRQHVHRRHLTARREGRKCVRQARRGSTMGTREKAFVRHARSGLGDSRGHEETGSPNVVRRPNLTPLNHAKSIS